MHIATVTPAYCSVMQHCLTTTYYCTIMLMFNQFTVHLNVAVTVTGLQSVCLRNCHPVSARNKEILFFLIKPTDAQIYFVKKLYMFWAVPVPIIRSLPLYIRRWYMYSGKLLMMGRGTA